MTVPMVATTAAVPAPAGPTYEFDEDFQTKITAMVLRDTAFAQITDGLIDPGYFGNSAEAALVDVATRYYREYRKAPSPGLWGTLLHTAIKAKRIRADLIPEIKIKVAEIISHDISDRDFVTTQVAEFAHNQAMEAALYRIASELLPKRDFAKIDQIMREAQNVGITDDAGEYDYYERVGARTTRRKEIGSGTFIHGGITSGVAELDKLLYHRGWGRKELSLLMAPAKGGKSMGLAEFAKNASLSGSNVIYFTLEVSAEITADRLDANISDTMMKELVGSPYRVEEALKKLEGKAGALKIHEYATGSLKASQMRRVLQRYRARGIVFDLIVVDYADIMAPEHRTDVERENSKSIYIDLRAIAFEEDAAVLTATQTNRDGAKATVATMTDVAEDFNKIRIADIVISINAMDAEKAAGEARLFFAAVRNGEDGFTLNIRQNRAKMRFIEKVLGRS